MTIEPYINKHLKKGGLGKADNSIVLYSARRLGNRR